MGASAVAAIIIKKEKHIVVAFRGAGATSAPAAVSPDALGVHQRLAFRKLRSHAVLREAGSGLFYLDEPSWEALQRFRRRLAVAIGLVVLFVLALTLFTTRMGAGTG
jgi:hypothetical protein